MIDQSIAVLVFANSAKEDMRSKKIKQGQLLFDGLSEHTLTEVRKTGVPFYHITEIEQFGTSFGERFANAIQSILEMGYENLIAIGNDSPQLKAAHITKAARYLKNGKGVLGPSLDGGFYLMGLKKEWFVYQSFLALPWQRQNLFSCTVGYFKNFKIQIEELDALIDIDSLRSVRLLLNHVKSISVQLLRLLSNIFSIRPMGRIVLPVFYQFHYATIPNNKGSPALA